jgi:antitoxin component YwqK of YwqJK toxin-antitoxin module
MHIEYYKDGTLCICDEMERTYYDSGALESEIPRIKNKICSAERWYHESGALDWENPWPALPAHRPMENFV